MKYTDAVYASVAVGTVAACIVMLAMGIKIEGSGRQRLFAWAVKLSLYAITVYGVMSWLYFCTNALGK